ncbi:6214_t:CDS:2 [Diversispora eburnea]|uniref:6214_t:CDS:1 n=1 Tax=Diversispora eburnea TaxID=1213867 RepID=A0A9N8YKY3_9GLOM|nr:6214_t:CDS:2 [Diversispora eburnea]
MLYPQYLPTSQQYQEPNNDDYSMLKNHHPKPTLVLYNHLPNQITPLGHPNRSCASCKKRKVKCDRKTPSCTACQKSKYKCHYTSYSPPVFNGNPKLPRLIVSFVPKCCDPDYYSTLGFAPQQHQEPYYLEDDIYNNFNNPMITTPSEKLILPTTPVEQQSHLSPCQQQQFSHHNQVQQEFYHSPNSYPISPQYQHTQHVQHTQAQSPFMNSNVMIQQVMGSYVPYMQATVTLSYNLNGMHIAHLQEWLKYKFMKQEWNDETDNICVIDPDEKFEIMESPLSPQNINNFSIQQKFTVILHRPEYSSSPITTNNSDHDDFEHSQYSGEDDTTDLDSHASYNSNIGGEGSNRSSMVLEVDHTDIFFNKVYAFVRRFIKNVPWIRENFAMHLRPRGINGIPSPMGFGFSEVAFSDVTVEVRRNNSLPSTPYTNRKFNNPDEIVAKGRMIVS